MVDIIDEKVKECFETWNEIAEDEDDHPPVADYLSSLPHEEIIKFAVNSCIDDKTWSLAHVWKDCFKNFFEVPHGRSDLGECIKQLSHNELVYFILNCENHANSEISIWTLIPCDSCEGSECGSISDISY